MPRVVYNESGGGWLPPFASFLSPPAAGSIFGFHPNHDPNAAIKIESVGDSFAFGMNDETIEVSTRSPEDF